MRDFTKLAHTLSQHQTGELTHKYFLLTFEDGRKEIFTATQFMATNFMSNNQEVINNAISYDFVNMYVVN